MARFESFSNVTSKVTAFSSKVPTKIFVNPGQCRWESVKTINDITYPKINVFRHNLENKCILTLPIILLINKY